MGDWSGDDDFDEYQVWWRGSRASFYNRGGKKLHLPDRGYDDPFTCIVWEDAEACLEAKGYSRGVSVRVPAGTPVVASLAWAPWAPGYYREWDA